MSSPRVSILIPTRNAERELARLLPAIERQQVSGGFELVVVDSASTDRTTELLRGAGAHVEHIDVTDFRHGGTRNRLARTARGSFLVFLSQDAVPQGEDFLERLLAPFSDSRVAGCTARVLPHEDDDPLTTRTVLEAPEAFPQSEVRRLDGPTAYDSMSPAERASILRFNNVASAIRASVLEQIPFPDEPFGEDSAWAGRALTAGWRLAFVAEAVVRHAHRYSPSQAFERYRMDAAFQRRVHGHRLRTGLWDVLRGIAYEVVSDVRFVARHRAGWHHLLRSPALRCGQILGQWRGSRGAHGGSQRSGA